MRMDKPLKKTALLKQDSLFIELESKLNNFSDIMFCYNYGLANKKLNFQDLIDLY